MSAADRPRRALLVVNPKARNGRVDLAAVRDELRRGGIEAVDPPSPEQECSALIREAADSVDLVILGGGDGTLNAAAQALAERKLPFGILPLGTANDLARSLALPVDPVAAARVIATLPARAIDLGCVNGHYFFNVASVGFSADLAGALTADLKRRFGTLGYGLAAFRLLRRSRPFTVILEHDGIRETLRTVQVSVGNGRHYGGGMTVEENASIDDGMLNVYSLEVAHWWRLLALLPALRRGTQGKAADVRAFRTTEVVLTTRKPRPVNTDGEIATQTPARIHVVPRAVLIHAPEPVRRAVASLLP
ncbi:lipid kinase [Methylobacterium sp. JK268]